MLNLPTLLHAAGLRRRWRALLLAMMAIVSWFAFMPQTGDPGGFTQMDKLLHLAAFCALSATAGLASDSTRTRLAFAAAALLAYGIFIELVQSLLPSRTADLADVVADALGIALGLSAIGWLRQRWPAPAG